MSDAPLPTRTNSPDSPPPAPPAPSAAAGMDKGYVPADHEPRIRARWETSGVFRAEPARAAAPGKPGRPPYCVLIPPPNVTGQLHLGHALNNTLQDILVRHHRMLGDETLWIVGTDHAGIATQAVVERRLRQEGKLKGPLRDAMTREQFVGHVQGWKTEYEARITEQLRAMGCSCDFSRQRFTMDPICARAVREAFYRLFKDGLIYRGKRLVNWDPALQTAVADDECFEEQVSTSFWYLRYPLMKPDGTAITWSELIAAGWPRELAGAETGPAWVTVATTRPETYLGDTAVAINPADPRSAVLERLNARVQLPLVGRVLPIVADDYVVLPKAMARTPEEAADAKAEFASGFLKVTPAHDANDYDLYQRHKAVIDTNSAHAGLINVFAPDASISDRHGWTDTGEAKAFVGLKRDAARKAIVEAFAAATIPGTAHTLLENTRPYTQNQLFSDRSKAPIEPYLSDQWFVRVTDDRLAGAANRALHDGQLTFHPSRYAKTFEQWHTNIRDWCISRQLWWGHQIPVWSKDSSKQPSSATLEALRQLGPERVTQSGWTQTLSVHPDGPSRLHYCVRSENDTQAIDILEKDGFTRDPDVLDTWFSSALWPLSTLGWPEPSQSADTAGLLETFNPTNVLSTAREIITLWVSRMVMMNRYLLGEGQGRGPVPFKDVFIHAVVQDGNGQRMSKSAGNGVDPLDIVASHGADAMRFTLCQMTTQTQDVRMPVVKDSKSGRNTSPKFDLGRNFANKLWNAARYAVSILSQPLAPGAAQTHTGRLLIDRWMLSRLADTTERATRALARYEFAGYAEAMYDLLWRDFCDVYLEAIKPTVAGSADQRAVLRAALEVILRLLHPVAPYVTEAIYEHVRALSITPIAGLSLGQSPTGLLCLAPWPVAGAALVDADATARIDRVRALIAAINQVRAEHGVAPKRRITLHASENVRLVVADGAGVVETLAGLGAVEPISPTRHAQGATDPASVTLVFEAAENRLSGLADALDSGSERDRLARKLGEEEKKVQTLTARLGNPGYIQRAPAKLVEETQSQLQQAQAEVDKIKLALAALN